MSNPLTNLKHAAQKVLSRTPPIPEEDYEGQLAVDVFQTDRELVIKAPIAGVKLSDMSITVSDNTVHIKGHRMVDEEIVPDSYYTQECYWGPFSRSVILPANVNSDDIAASFKDGILRIVIPKTQESKAKSVSILPE